MTTMQTDAITAAHAYRAALQLILQAKSLTAAQHHAQRVLQWEIKPAEDAHITIEAGVGLRTGEAFVTFSLANPSESANPSIQMTTQEARQQAQYILEAAAAADMDRLVMGWIGDESDFTDAKLASLLQSFRAYRQAQAGGQQEEPPV
jgi:hypothetical protein